MKKFLKSDFLPVVYLLLFAGLSRFWPHPWNATAIGALALLAGSEVKNSALAVLGPILVLLVTDLFLGFHVTMPFVYGAVILAVWLGRKKSPGLLGLGGASLASSVGFFVISNIGVWMVSGLYPKTGAGLVNCFVMAWPFFKGHWAGDLVYTAVVFGGWALIKNRAQRFEFSESLT